MIPTPRRNCRGWAGNPWPLWFVACLWFVFAWSGLAHAEAGISDRKPIEVHMLDGRGQEGPPSIPGLPTPCDTICFGHYQTIQGQVYAVQNQTWTWDHGSADPLEGWTSVDLSANTTPYFRQITTASWGIHGNPVSAPIIAGAGSVWLGAFEDEADLMCWAAGLGYGNEWCQRLTSPSLTYNGVGAVNISFSYFNNTELNFDYTRVFIRKGATEIPLNGAGFTGVLGNPAAATYPTFSVSVPQSTMGGAGSWSLVFQMTSDVSWSDQDGNYATSYGPFGVDGIAVSGGGASASYTFETNLQGFTASFCPAIGRYMAVHNVGIYTIADPGACNLSGNVLSLHDASFQHPVGQHELAVSPIVDKSAFPSLSTILAKYDVYADLPTANGVFFRPQWSYYPYVCPASGSIGWSPSVGVSGYYGANPPDCYSSVDVATANGVPASASKVKFEIELLGSCAAFGIPPNNCSGVSNATPIFDNIKVCVTCPNRPSGCQSADDACCEAAPAFTDTAYSNIHGSYGSFLSGKVAVGTQWQSTSTPTSPVVTVMDLSAPPTGGVGMSYNPAAWSVANLGTVFGLTLDSFGNIYVCHSSCYNEDGLGAIGGRLPGCVYRIDALTGAVTLFARLPNYADPNVAAGQNYPGLGNITYDCDHNQFFVSDLEDGRIYCLRSGNANNASPAVVQSSPFDHAAQDLGPSTTPPPPTSPTPGWAPPGERIWAVQWHSNRIYYSVWSQDILENPGAGPNTIWSVGLNASGNPVPGTDQWEITLPTMPFSNYSNPVSDISFNAAGRLLAAERSMYDPTSATAHNSRVIEYLCEGSWFPTSDIFLIGVHGTDSAGGVDYDRVGGSTSMDGLVWATGDYLSSSPLVYGIQGTPSAGGNNTPPSILIDMNGDTSNSDKTEIGDVEIPCVLPDPHTGRICVVKFNDLDHDGVWDAGEPTIPNWSFTLTGPVNRQGTTNAAGELCFTDLPAGTYTVCEINAPGWVQTAPTPRCYTVTLAEGQSVVGLRFGNYLCRTDSCQQAPVGIIGYYPFFECSGSSTVDFVSANNGTLVGTPLPTWVPFIGGCALQFTTAGQFVQAAVTNTAYDFFTGSFSVHAWIRCNAATGIRAIVDRRDGTPTNAHGFSFYIRNGYLGVQLANGAYQNFESTGPIVADDTWRCVAAVVKRTATTRTVTLYSAGAVIGSWSGATVPAGSINTLAATTPLRIGEESFGFLTGIPFSGSIDEVSIYNTALTASQIGSICNDIPLCCETCYVPRMVAGFSGARTTLRICNYCWDSSGSYSWSIAGLPAGPGCPTPGPTVFTPSSGTVTVPSGSCQPTNIQITFPSGMPYNTNACYEITVTNNQTGQCCTTTGMVKKRRFWFDYPDVWPELPASFSESLVVPIVNGDSLPHTIVYELVGRSADGDPENNNVRLNGMPEGVPVVGSIDLAPQTTGTIDLTALLMMYRPWSADEIVLSADAGNGMEELGVLPLTSIPAQSVSSAEEQPAVAIPEGLSIRSNPFREETTVLLRLNAPREADVSVYDVNGRLVRSLARGPMAAGSHELHWDGLNDAGQRARSGVYFIRLHSAGTEQSVKVVRMR